jgi:putative transposase
MTTYKQANRWLYDAPSDSLQHALKDVERAFKNFFDKRAKYPRFKAKHRTMPALRYPKDCVLEGNRLKLPKLGWVRCFNSHEPSTIKSVTVKQTPSGEWLATCVTEFIGQPPKAIETACGVDLGLKDFAVITDGTNYQHVEPPKFFRLLETRLAKAQKALSRKKKGSNNAAKAKRIVAKLNKRIGNLRANWLHQTSNELVNEYDLICLEDLSLKGMAKTNLAKSVLDAALGEFVGQVEYKALWEGKTVQKIDRFFPSSKLCGICGTVNKDLTLSDRAWVCVCGAKHDRDRNAALNILKEGLNLSTGRDTASLKLLRMGKPNVFTSLHRPLTQESHVL